MASHGWSAGRALLLLASLPLHASAQVDPAATTSAGILPDVEIPELEVPEVEVPGVEVSVGVGVPAETTTEILPEPTTTEPAIVVEQTTTSAEAPIVDETTTSTGAPAQDTTTSVEAPVQDTTISTEVFVQDTTTSTEVPVQDTTTSTEVPAQDSTTSTEFPIDTTASTELPVAPTTTSTWIPDASETVEPINTPESTTSTELPVQDTTTSTEVSVDTATSTELPVDITTTTDLPVDPTSTTEQLSVTTTTDLPVEETTTTELPVDTTTTEQLVDPTTTTQPAAEATTTTAALPAETTTEPPAESATDGQDEPTITQPPAQTVTGPAATSAVSSVSTEIDNLIPIIDSWKEDPENLKDETKDKVDDVHDDIVAVIVGLGGDPNQDCTPGINILNTLICIAKDLTEISGNIVAGNVPAVTGATDSVQSQNDDLNEEEKEEEKSDEQSEEESTEEPTSTSTSPCTEDTADHVTIVCKPTTVTEGGNVQVTETCFESITVEVTGCSVTEATTVISTTGTAAAITPCASGTCGDACPLNAAPLSGADMAVVSATVNCDEISTHTTSEIPTSFARNPIASPTPRAEGEALEKRELPLEKRIFMHNTTPNPFYVTSLNPIWVSQLGDASGHWLNFPDIGQGFAGVNGIYGCTAVIIVSNKGVYLSHIWENPVFIDSDWKWTDDESFNRNSFEALRDGTDYAQSILGLIGTDEAPGVLHSFNMPQVFVITPFTNFFNDPTGTMTAFRYESRAQSLLDNLIGIIPGSTGSLLGYTRTGQQESTETHGTWGRAILEVDMFQDAWMTPEDFPGGSHLYSMGRWRLWVEDGLVTWQDFIITDSGVALDDFPTTTAEGPEATEGAVAPQRLRKREDSPVEQCLVRTRASTTEATSTTETTETTQSSTETTQTSTDTTLSTETTTQTSVTETTETTETTQSTETSESTVESTTETSTQPPTTFRTSTITTTAAPDTTSDETSTTEPPFTGPVLCVNHGGPRVATPYCQCSTTTAGQTFFATAPLISLHCTDYTTFPEAVTPTTAKEETPEPTATNPNADVPEVECSTPDDCDDWEGDCAFGPSSNHVVCLATDWHKVNGVPTSGKSICECMVSET
ncbi:hypothetical protein FALBO_4823 [Fusarium albosuccineum]|uniref:Uncharacterized protein n=1 Tax=Fusarium albosuccineum TaxID=1237068 RepID=A0A8H4PDA4_9HYPO|nr:hypothetical protein FALBO_4823 [Fusarium albosuccineum]